MPGFFVSRALQPVSPVQGESGYFSSPDTSLDPHLFDGEHFKPEVAAWIKSALYGFWGSHYNRPESWSTVWVAGSGVSYQWSSGRGNGDLDVLIGVNFPKFWHLNPSYRGLTENEMAAEFNEVMHRDLWPATDNSNINGQVYEVTFYVNPKGEDIRDIHPYAAYDLTHDTWTVRPPSGNDFVHSPEFYAAAEAEDAVGRSVIERYNRAASSGDVHSARLASSQASLLYDDIHLGRKQAFGPGGSGYGDYYNFRWQAHKKSGLAQTLHAVADAYKQDQEDLFGKIDGAEVALRRAALWNRGGNGH